MFFGFAGQHIYFSNGMRIKICGLRDKNNIEQIAMMEFDYMGFIFYSKSKRFVGDDFEMPVISNKIKKTGVFVNTEIDEVKRKVNKYGLKAVQLHGDESVEYCSELRRCLQIEKKDIEIIKAFGVNEAFDFGNLAPYEASCDFFLFDTKTIDYGGSGKRFDWSILKKYTNKVPYFLSGGIGVEYLEQLKNEQDNLGFYAIDVNSKFELKPGLKDMELMNRLVDYKLTD